MNEEEILKDLERIELSMLRLKERDRWSEIAEECWEVVEDLIPMWRIHLNEMEEQL